MQVFFRSNSRQELVLVTISIIFAYVTMVDGEPRLPVVGDIPAGLPGFMSGSQLDGEHDLLRCGIWLSAHSMVGAPPLKK